MRDKNTREDNGHAPGYVQKRGVFCGQKEYADEKCQWYAGSLIGHRVICMVAIRRTRRSRKTSWMLNGCAENNRCRQILPTYYLWRSSAQNWSHLLALGKNICTWACYRFAKCFNTILTQFINADQNDGRQNNIICSRQGVLYDSVYPGYVNHESTSFSILRATVIMRNLSIVKSESVRLTMTLWWLMAWSQ